MKSAVRKLGRQPARRDHRTLRLANYLRAYPAPPPARDWTGPTSPNWGELLNLQVGDCTVASCGHALQVWTANHGAEITPSDADILATYRAVSGYDPANPLTDTGAVYVDVMSHWRKTGIAGHQIEAYVAVDPRNRMEIEAAINLFGGVFLGLDLPLAAQGQTIWDVAPPGQHGDAYRPGSWGGHAVLVVAYSRTGMVCITWGQPKVMTWEFELTYAEEAYAALGPDWSRDGVLAPNGFDVNQLRADLAAITK